MKKSIRVISILLAFVMMMGTMSVAASAAHSDYLDSAITDQYNSIDKVELELNQKASILLDQLDIMLIKEDIYISIPLIGDIDLRSTDAALDSIYSITGNWLFGDLTVGDLGVLEDSRSEIATIRRSSASPTTDMDVIKSLIAYLAGCAEDGLLNIVNKDFNWGILKGFLPPEFRIIIDDVPKYIKETLWDVMHPVNEVAMPDDTTLDTLAQFALDNQIGAVEGSDEAIALGFAGILPGFIVDLDVDNAYRVFDEAIFSVLNNVVVDILNNELKDTIVHAVEANTDDGGNLASLVNVNYTVSGYTYDRTQPLVSQLNDMFKGVVEQMLITGKSQWVSTADGAAAGRSNVENLKYNLEVLLKQIIVAGGESENVSNYTLAELGDYLTRISVENFVTHLEFAQGDSMEKIAYYGVRELVIRLVPEVTYADLPANTDEATYRAALYEMAADLGCYYLNANIGLNLPYSSTAEEFISAFIVWCEPYINGLFDPTALNNVRNSTDCDGWAEIDAIIWEFFPKEWMPYEEMFRDNATTPGTADELTFKSLLDYFMDAVFTMDIDKLYTFFTYKTNSPLATMKADAFIIDFISNILDGAFSVGTTACVPTGITTFESLLENDMAHAKTIIKNILVALRDKTVTVAEYNETTQAYENATYRLDETVVNLVCMLLGFADPQSLSDVDMDMSGRVYCENGTVPSTNLRIYNHSNGVNSAWRNASGVLAQDKMYEIELVSLTNNAGLTASVTEGAKIAANSYLDVAVSGTITATSEVRFDLTYYLLDEAGNRINNNTPLVKSIYSHFYTATGNYDLTSAEVTANNVTFDSFSTYLYTTDVYDMALFSIMATNNSGLLTSAATISKSIVTGTLPTGITANAPTSGSIVALEDSSASSDTYGTVNPYVANIDNDAAQPYGIYDLDIQFEVKGTGVLGNETSATTEARDHIIVIYDDFNLDGVLADVMDENRQYSDYANADTEWAAYQNAVSAGYALLQGNPDHTKMFTDVNADLEGTQNAYYTAVQNIEAAVAALDAKAITDTAKLTALQTAVNTYNDVDPDDYVLFTYDRFEDAYDRAANLVNSQVAPVGEEATFVAPALKAFDLVYAKEQLELWGGRLLKKTPVTTHLVDVIEAVKAISSVNYSNASWTAVKTALADAEAAKTATLQTTVNDARIALLNAKNNLTLATTTYLIATTDSNVVIDNGNLLVTNIGTGKDNIDTLVTATSSSYTVDCTMVSGFIVTGSTITVKQNSDNSIVATYEAVVNGDVDGDGTVGSSDAEIVYAHIFEDSSVLTFGSAAYVAADADSDGTISEDDFAELYGHLFE